MYYLYYQPEAVSIIIINFLHREEHAFWKAFMYDFCFHLGRLISFPEIFMCPTAVIFP